MNSVEFNPASGETAQNYPEQAMSQVFGCAEIQTKVFRFLSIPQILGTREVCREWKDACHLSVSDALCRELQQNMACYLAHAGETFSEYLAARNICPSELSVTDAFLRLAPIKCKVAIGKCLSVFNLSEINEETLTQSIVHSVSNEEDKRWSVRMLHTAEKLGYPRDPKIKPLDIHLTPAEEAKNESLLLKSCLPAVPKIVEILKKTNGVPHITLRELAKENRLSKKVKEAGLVIAFPTWSRDARIGFGLNKKRLCECFPVTLFDFDTKDFLPNEQGQRKKSFSIQSAIGRRFCFPMGMGEDEQLFEFEICPQEECSEGDIHVNVTETGERSIDYNGWELIHALPYSWS